MFYYRLWEASIRAYHYLKIGLSATSIAENVKRQLKDKLALEIYEELRRFYCGKKLNYV